MQCTLPALLALCLLPQLAVAHDYCHNASNIDCPGGKVTLELAGVPGQEGPKGEKGVQGSIGLSGLKGEKGLKGNRGIQGVQGPPGGLGLPGLVGQRGAHGPEGPEGERGPQGFPGLPGPQGLQGPQGDTILNQDEFDKVVQALQKNISTELNRNRATFMESRCGIYSTRWRRVALIDMTDPTAQCPSGLREVSNSTTKQRACGRSISRGCSSVTFPIGEMYCHVCGRVRGYQYRTPDAFNHSDNPINDAYLDGISITHGSPQRHLWSFAASYYEQWSGTQNYICACDRPDPDNSRWYVPDFVGQDYYCESGFVTSAQSRIAWEDPLWDGAGCVTPGNTCCQRYGWFHKQVNLTSDSIEVRWCADQWRSNEDVFTDLVEIWVLD